jgi:hypothetical protein
VRNRLFILHGVDRALQYAHARDGVRQRCPVVIML